MMASLPLGKAEQYVEGEGKKRPAERSMEVQGLPLTLVSPTGKQATPHLPAKTFANQQGPRDCSRQMTMEETEYEEHLQQQGKADTELHAIL
ncbi:hypothetical protein DPX16_17047 [Anabarilius grahami]|uniref:Uncharacterized protein n=1 Tax=Anabarilius grahami TaxID=495550 RepID=A0A3N0YAG9_ANAGA|nr:hypothetical protein DPX16_17047 [Anabarilius grahami]